MSGRNLAVFIILALLSINIKAQKKEDLLNKLNLKRDFNKSESLCFSKAGKAIVNKAKIKKIDSILISFTSGNIQKLLFNYNNKNQVQSFDFYTNKANDWILAARERHVYDSIGRITDLYIDMLVERWFNYKWKKEFYNQSGDKIGSIIKTWGPTGWENTSQMLTKNDSLNKVAVQISQEWIDNNWVNSFRTTTDLVQNDTAKTILSEIWDNNSWQYYWLQNLEFNRNGSAKSALTRTWNGADWENNLKINFFYGVDKENFETFQIWDTGIWNDAERFVYNTDAENWFLNGRYEILGFSNWIPSDGPITLINPDGFELHFLAKTMQVFYSNPLVVNNERAATINNFDLQQNYPNPFNPTTNIQFNLNKPGNVVLSVYDILGREVKTLVNEYKTAGSNSVSFNGAELPSGVYIYKLVSNNNCLVRKMQLLK